MNNQPAAAAATRVSVVVIPPVVVVVRADSKNTYSNKLDWNYSITTMHLVAYYWYKTSHDQCKQANSQYRQ